MIQYVKFKTYISVNPLAPLEIYGPGEYALTDVKEIDVTKSFLSDLSIETRECQDKDTVESCQTKNFLEDVQKDCKCIPFGLKNYSIPQKGAIKVFKMSLLQMSDMVLHSLVSLKPLLKF